MTGNKTSLFAWTINRRVKKNIFAPLGYREVTRTPNNLRNLPEEGVLKYSMVRGCCKFRQMQNTENAILCRSVLKKRHFGSF